MDKYDESFFEEAEKDVDRIRKAALKLVQITHPEIAYVVDRRTIDDYAMKSWDYPGQWYYMGLKLPDGFRSEEELIRQIAEDTISYFDKRNKGSSRWFKRK